MKERYRIINKQRRQRQRRYVWLLRRRAARELARAGRDIAASLEGQK